MNPVDEDDPRPDGTDLQRILILAYTRLFLMPELDDGSKLTTIATFGRFDVRLIELQDPQPDGLAPLWVELFDNVANRALDSAGCRDLQDAGSATETFVEAARRLSGASPFNSGRGSPAGSGNEES